uniref:Single-stranded DNA-binding protein n=1 Tax=uncultured bacterium Contig1770 TaxID=1393510 RepID=W0FMQ2_9BACT|nr:single-strand binding protein [uncultured bacterium Contig1770]
MSINSVIISGNIGREPELRISASGNAVMRFSVAVNDRVKNPQTGEWEDRPNWVGVVMFGQRAQSLRPYLSKGSKVAISGRLRYSAWETQDGGKQSRLEVVADALELMSRSKASNAPQGGTGAENGQMPPETAGNQPQTGYEGDMYECDIPF